MEKFTADNVTRASYEIPRRSAEDLLDGIRIEDTVIIVLTSYLPPQHGDILYYKEHTIGFCCFLIFAGIVFFFLSFSTKIGRIFVFNRMFFSFSSTKMGIF